MLLEIIFVASLCILSFIIGRLSAEKDDIKYETNKFYRGSTAGDNAVRAFRMRKQK